MENETYLFLAFGISWVVFAVYLWSINKQTQSVREEIEALRQQEDGEP